MLLAATLISHRFHGFSQIIVFIVKIFMLFVIEILKACYSFLINGPVLEVPLPVFVSEVSSFSGSAFSHADTGRLQT